MKEILTIVFLVIAFLVVVFLIANVFLKKNADVKKEAVPEKKEEKKEDVKKDDIPEILKEVTMGNYLFENAKLSENEQLKVDMVENSEIKKEEKTFRVELGEELEEDEIDELFTAKDIVNQMDLELEEDEDETQNTEVVKEIKDSSKTLKGIIISNILNKKDDF